MQNNWGGKRNCAGRKKTCSRKIPYNRRIDENVLKILREYSQKMGVSETQALETAILLQNNIAKQKGAKFMKIVVPSAEGKLCGHFGHCESFTFVDVDIEKKEILSIEERVPEEGISCQSASWIAAQGANVVLAGGMGGRPANIFSQNGVLVVAGCPELEIKEVVNAFLAGTLITGENSCGGEHHHCAGHEGGHHHCGGHH